MNYTELPSPPQTISATSTIVRMLDALAFRYKWSLEGLDESYLPFRPAPDCMSLLELVEHVRYLAFMLQNCFVKLKEKQPKAEGLEGIKKQTLDVLLEVRLVLLGMKDEELADCVTVHKRTGQEVSFWYFLNGPLADALTHVGQINSWRRIAGKPVYSADVFLGLPPRENLANKS